MTGDQVDASYSRHQQAKIGSWKARFFSYFIQFLLTGSCQVGERPVFIRTAQNGEDKTQTYVNQFSFHGVPTFLIIFSSRPNITNYWG